MKMKSCTYGTVFISILLMVRNTMCQKQLDSITNVSSKLCKLLSEERRQFAFAGILQSSVKNKIFKGCNSSYEDNTVLIALSCEEFTFLKTYLMNSNTNNLCFKKHRSRKHNRIQIAQNMFLMTYQNVVASLWSLITYWKVENAMLILDPLAGIETESLTTYLNLHSKGMNIVVLSIDPITDLMKRITYNSSKYWHYITVCTKHNTRKIIEMAELNGLFKTKQRWIIVSEILPEIFNSIFISSESQVTLVKPLNNEATADVLHYGQTIVQNIMSSVNARNIDSKISRSEENYTLHLKHCRLIVIYDVFYSPQTMRVEIIKFAFWTVQNGLSVLEMFEKEDEAQRLRGRILRTAAFTCSTHNLPYVSITRDNGTTNFSGYKVDVMSILMRHFNAKYTIIESEPSWGVVRNGTYTGLLGVVYKRDIDIPINGFGLLDFRLRVLRYLAPLAKVDVSLTYVTPLAIIPPTLYALPFRLSVWMTIFIAFWCILFTLAIAMYCSPGWKYAKIPTMLFHNNFSRLITFTFLTDAQTDPPGSPAKIIFGTAIVAGLAVSVFYTSVFTSFLAYRELKMPIKNVQDLIESTEYNAINVKGSHYEVILRSAHGGVFKHLWQKMEKNEKLCLQPTVAHGIKTMYDGKNVLTIDGASTIAAMKNNCSISLFRTRVYREYFNLVTRTDFPYSRMFYIKLLRLTEGGLLQRFGKIYMTDSRPSCPVETPSLTLGILQVRGLFIVFSCGILLSLFALCIEKSMMRKSKKIRNNP